MTTHSPLHALAERLRPHAITILYDQQGDPYTVDADIDHMVERKRVFTRNGELYTEVLRIASTKVGENQQVARVLLAKYLWEIWEQQTLHASLRIIYEDGNPRNLCRSNMRTVHKAKKKQDRQRNR